MPSGVKAMPLSGPFDPLLNPGLLHRIGDVHELDAERGAIGPVQDLQHLPDGGVLQTKNIVEEDLPVVVRFGKAVGRRRQFVIVLYRLGDAERVEIGVQMAAHAEGADHHDGADGIARGAAAPAPGQGLAVGGRLALDLLLDELVDRRPVAVEGRDEFAIGGDRPVRLRPGGAARVLADVAGIVLERAEEVAPFRRNGLRVVLIGGL